MAGEVGGLLASAVVRIAKDKLGSAIVEQASLLWNFRKDLGEMKDDLETISAVLEDAERQSVREEFVRLCLKRLKHAAIDISDLLEDYQDTVDQASAKMSRVLLRFPVRFKKRIAMANRIKDLTENLRKIKNDMDSFGLKNGSGTTNEQPHIEHEAMSCLPEEPVIGRDKDKQQIINLLSANNTNDDEIFIVYIYGLGGMGKSTLAKLVYYDAQFKQYDHRVWVYVSQNFDLIKIGLSIISKLQTPGCQQNMVSREVIKDYLHELLHGKTILVVLDDLWEENMTEVEALKSMLRVKGSKVDVIVTTRKEDIAGNFSTSGRLYKLEALEDDECWEIIKRYSKFELKYNHEQMRHIGLDIAKKCGGVALAARAVGFMLRSIDDLNGWKEINNSDIWNSSSVNNNVLPSLTLSYERMPSQLRICFSYCAIFPKGHNIVEDDLVQQWTALDFVEQSKGKKCVKELLGMSFLQVSMLPSRSYNTTSSTTSQEHGAVRYTMHDLVHDLARWTMEDELKVYDVAPIRRNIGDNKYCLYSLLTKYDPTMKLKHMPPKMRALCFSDSGELLDIQSGAFSFAKCLRVLDFSECSSILLPPSIGEPKKLRCLIAPRMQNDSLPRCITKLTKLQYLNINGSSKISLVPESIGKLGCLKHLCLSGCSGISKLPESFGDLKSMIHLDMSGCFGIRELPESFGDLKSMVHLDMSGCSWITELPDSLGKLVNLQHLELSGCSSIKAIPQLLCGLRQLRYMNISSCKGLDRLPEGIGGLLGLEYLNMSSCVQIRELPESLMKLKNLLHLDLQGCRNMQHLGGVRGLTTLQHLDMSRLDRIGLQHLSDVMANLTNLKFLNLCSSIASTSVGHHLDWIGGITDLEHLDLSFNWDLRCLPESIGNLKRLHTLDLTCCFSLNSLPESIRALGLKSLVLNNCSDELMDQASSLVHYSQTLPDFKVCTDSINGCSNLHLLEGENVSELSIYSLENVMSLEEAKKLKLLDKHNLLDLTLAWSDVDDRADQQLEDKDLLGELVPPRGLKNMTLDGYRNKRFPSWLMGICHHLPNIVSISLGHLPACTKLPPLGQLPHLGKLELGDLPRVKRINWEFCGGRGAFRKLSYFSLDVMDRLVEWNTTYSVEDGVEEYMFPVLDYLWIGECPRLRLKPCPPTFVRCYIALSDQVISSLVAIEKTSRLCSPSRVIKMDLNLYGYDSGKSISLFHHFPLLRELTMTCVSMSLPESMSQLTCLESLTLESCSGISSLPGWLGDLSSLKSLIIKECRSIKSLPPCIQKLTKLQWLEIKGNEELKEWCESEENKAKLAHINVQFRDSIWD